MGAANSFSEYVPQPIPVYPEVLPPPPRGPGDSSFIGPPPGHFALGRYMMGPHSQQPINLVRDGLVPHSGPSTAQLIDEASGARAHPESPVHHSTRICGAAEKYGCPRFAAIGSEFCSDECGSLFITQYEPQEHLQRYTSICILRVLYCTASHLWKTETLSVSNWQIWPLVSGSRVREEPCGLQMASSGGHHLSDWQLPTSPMRSPAEFPSSSGYSYDLRVLEWIVSMSLFDSRVY